MRALLSAAALVVCAYAQGPTVPPPILQLIRKPGFTSNAVRPYGEARAAVDVVGMTAMTGLPETWLIECHPNFGSVEDVDKALAAVSPKGPFNVPADPFRDHPVTPARTILASFLPDWSYRPDQAIRLFPRAHYFIATLYQIRAGTESDYGQLVKLRQQSAESVNLDRPDLAYEVISGAPSGTFLFLSPITSLRSFDEGVASMPVYAEGLADTRSKTRTKVAPDSELSREHLLFRVEPRLSHVSDEFASQDHDFWRPQQ